MASDSSQLHLIGAVVGSLFAGGGLAKLLQVLYSKPGQVAQVQVTVLDAAKEVVTLLQTQVGDLTSKMSSMESKYEALLEQASLKISHLEAQLAVAEREIRELQRENEELTRRVNRAEQEKGNGK